MSELSKIRKDGIDYSLKDETARAGISGKLDASYLPTAINTALAKAKASGEFDGKDGVNGKDGKDGVSPRVSTSAFNGGTIVTFTTEDDESGSGTSFKIYDGENGADGYDGAPGFSPTVDIETTVVGESISTEDDDIIAPDRNGVIIRINDKDGSETAEVLDGRTPWIGNNGNWFIGVEDTGVRSVGADGKDGADYVLTDADKDEIAETVKAEVPLVKTAEQPFFVNNKEECIDTSRVYLLPDGFLWAFKKTIAKRVTPLTSEDFIATNVNTDGVLNNVTTSKIRIASAELLPLSGDLLCINCPSPYQYIVYYYTEDKESTYIGKTSFKSGGTTNILTETAASGTIAGATYCRIALRDSTNTNAMLTDRVDEFMSAISVEYVGAVEEEISEWANTGLSYNQPADYDDRIAALEKALEGIEYGSF